MGYFDNKDNVESYIKMVDGYDGSAIVEVLVRHLAAGSSVLELGMGPGKDLELLSKHFSVTGSDSSSVFVDRYKSRHPHADVIVLDAVEFKLDRTFDAMFSNKVLQHLPKPDAAKSIEAQHGALNSDGIMLHTLWHGDSVDEHHGLLFQQYTIETFSDLVADYFDVVDSARYTEMEADDSLYVVCKRR